MLTSWLTTLKRRWQQVGGALAVLLMFFIPVTRAVLAGTVTSGDHHQHADKTGDKTKDNTRASGKTSGPTTPVNPSPMATTSKSKKGTGEGEHHHKPHGK